MCCGVSSMTVAHAFRSDLSVAPATRRGIRVPDEVAVVGCDGLPFGRYTVPPLTSVLLDQGRLGRTAVKHILDTERFKEARCSIRLLPCLEQRESTQITKQKNEGSI